MANLNVPIFFGLVQMNMQSLYKGIYGSFLKWGYPEWMAYNGKSLSKMDGLGYPYFRKPPAFASGVGEDQRITVQVSVQKPSWENHL